MPPSSRYILGLDFGTAAVRALIVDALDGREVGVGADEYPGGVVVDPGDPNLARQRPRDYETLMTNAVGRAAAAAREADPRFDLALIGAIGLDTTGSTPLPVDERCRALSLSQGFGSDTDAMAWLWKDHTAHAEAAEITDLIRRTGRPFLNSCGGAYSSEWFWSKALRCVRKSPRVAAATCAWMEVSDYLPALLCGVADPRMASRGVCAAGHKAMYHPAWGGLPDSELLDLLDPTGTLSRWKERFRLPARSPGTAAGTLCEKYAAALGLRTGVPVAVGALDAHMGAVGSGVGPGTMVKIIGTSTCDCLVTPMGDEREAGGIPGVAGVVPHSIVPGMLGIEAGQAAVGDIFGWFAAQFGADGDTGRAHEVFTADASRLRPGESGLLALDWHNGNRNVLSDHRLSGAVLGFSLHTTPAEVYRSLIEATAFGARMIVDRLCEHRVGINRIICCGGIAEKNPLLMRVYADVLGRPMFLCGSKEACALGSACMAAVAAGMFPDVAAVQARLCRTAPGAVAPVESNAAVYRTLFALYRRLHDSLGGVERASDLADVLKTLLEVRDRQRAGGAGGAA